METFICAQCSEAKPVQKDGGTGYGVTPDGNKVCYACCGENDRKDTEAGKPIVLYLTWENNDTRNAVLTNWPGTLRILAGAKQSKRGGGFGCQRTDVWFKFAGKEWHGVNRGDMQITRCKPLKAKRR